MPSKYDGDPQYKSTYGSWRNMLARCRNPKYPWFHNYGGRGIKVCERWYKFDNFLADMGIKPPGLTLDRKDNDGPYSPDNCKWGTWEDQGNNRRTTKYVEFRGVSMTMLEFIKAVNTPRKTVESRLRLGWSLEEIAAGSRPRIQGRFSHIRIRSKARAKV